MLSTSRHVIGFDLRVLPLREVCSLVASNPGLKEQFISYSSTGIISGDPNIMLRDSSIEELIETQKDMFGPSSLASCLDDLLELCKVHRIRTQGMLPLSFTVQKETINVLEKRFGKLSVAHQNEMDLEDRGWQFCGYDALDLNGLISGLTGCGYSAWCADMYRAEWGKSINQYGLLNSKEAAYCFAETRGLEIPAHAPFTVVGVFAKFE